MISTRPAGNASSDIDFRFCSNSCSGQGRSFTGQSLWSFPFIGRPQMQRQESPHW